MQHKLCYVAPFHPLESFRFLVSKFYFRKSLFQSFFISSLFLLKIFLTNIISHERLLWHHQALHCSKPAAKKYVSESELHKS